MRRRSPLQQVVTRGSASAGVLLACMALGLAACSPTLDSLRARRDKLDATIPSSASAAAACVNDSATRAGARVENTNYDAELAISEVVLTFGATDTSGPEFSAWYEFSPRDGKNARVVYSFDAREPYRAAAHARALEPVKACGGDAAPR